MTTNSDQAPLELKREQAERLRTVLLECIYMQSPDKRREVMSNFQKDYKQITFETNSDPKVEVAGIIDRCTSFGGAKCFESFLESLESFEGADSATVKAVRAVWIEIVDLPVPDQLRGSKSSERDLFVRPVTSTRVSPNDEFSKAGSTWHWDRDSWVDELVDIVKTKSGKEDIRILAFPAPAEADPNGFAYYLEAKCNALSRSSDIDTRIVPVRFELTDRLQVHQFVARILSLLASKSEPCREGLRDASEQIRKEWESSEAGIKPSPGSLAGKFSRYLQEAAKTCRPVILIHSLEGASEELRTWLLYTWLESYQYDLQGIVVVLVGTPESGLNKSLSQPPYMICKEPLPEMDSHDLWEWAVYGYDLTWLPEEFIRIANKSAIRGSARKFLDFIVMCKAFEQLVSREKLLLLLSEWLEKQR